MHIKNFISYDKLKLTALLGILIPLFIENLLVPWQFWAVGKSVRHCLIPVPSQRLNEGTLHENVLDKHLLM